MIHLDVQEYCHECRDFEPCKSTTYLQANGMTIASDNVIYCEHCARCANIAAYLKKKLSEEKKDDQG